MAMTELVLVFLAALATLATIGLFKDFGDEATRAVVGFAGALIWLIVGISSFDVIVTDSGESAPIMPLVFLGLGLGAVVALFSLNVLRHAVQTEVEETDASSLL